MLGRNPRRPRRPPRWLVTTAATATPTAPRTLEDALAHVDRTGSIPWSWRLTFASTGLVRREGERFVLTAKGRAAMGGRS